jgi:regulator of protease activity HflC (stomatin/prohibitin superfamily)
MNITTSFIFGKGFSMSEIFTPSSSANSVNRDRIVNVQPGAVMLVVVLGILLGGVALSVYGMVAGIRAVNHPYWWVWVTGLAMFILSFFLFPGFFTIQPNESRVLILFGRYVGTVRAAGFHWGNPFYSNRGRHEAAMVQVETDKRAGSASAGAKFTKPSRFRVSLRVRNMISDRLKVNDKRGNPVEIAAVIVWRVHDAAQAVFDVEDYENYVRIQSESAIRHVASAYAYDHGEENEVTLRSGADEVAEALRAELQERLSRAGVTVEETRLTHLAYAPEIAQAMLRRQQAEAVIAARQKIVHGAVSMVDMALKELAEKQVVTLDDERRAAMVSNLMVVLCGESEVHPVVNTGTLYT